VPHKAKIKGSAPKVRNKDRAPGYWLNLHNARNNRQRVLATRGNRDWPSLSDTGSAAYRRLH
jgi:hypothetical protein